MDNVVDLKEFEAARAIRRTADLWAGRFADELTVKTMLGDLAGRTILTLARLEKSESALVYDLVTRMRGVGDVFAELSGPDKMAVIDPALFLIDQIRWEALGRLGWIEGYAGQSHPIVELVLSWEKVKRDYEPATPTLAPSHPAHGEYLKRKNVDGEAMIRSLIPAALAALSQKV